MLMKEISKLSEKELRKLILKSKEELFKLRFQKAGGHVTNTSRFREIRKDVARARLALGQLTAKK
ncbi:MAG: 50S ribosomal protein L29 [Rickettsiales bacterium]|nr:50S ribosomal protein L29 [Rickettsiales bacterium]|tara:strand:- start:12564 stop:12758 length:195 start_codon:yes stop_codon:yes gene_type:complete